jgi:hypothetical protein
MTIQETGAAYVGVDVDVTDERVADLADFLGETPEEVLVQAGQFASENGDTVSEELDAGEDMIALVGTEDATESDDDDDDEDEDEDELEALAEAMESEF